MGGGRQASVQEDSIAAITIQLPPGLVGKFKARDHTTILKLVWLLRFEDGKP
jgi:hypothetical protein